MTIGEHLEELRSCVFRSLVVLLLSCLACIWPAKYLLELIARPVVLVLRNHGQPDSFLATSPVENIIVYIKVVLIFGALIAAPYIIYQLWSFAAAGLYKREKDWVYRLVPMSIGLFLAGVAFMYVFVLVVSLNFLVGFSGWLPLPQPKASPIERVLLGLEQPEGITTQPAPGSPGTPVLPILADDPNSAPEGAAWLNLTERKLKVQGLNEETYSVQVLRDDRRALVTTHFRIGEYLTFVLIMTLAFGAAFQTPLVVVFLARTGIVPADTFRKYRKVVILIIVIIAGVLAPPDLLSHLLLSGPMIILFETGLRLAGRAKPSTTTSTE
jgi:Tat protein translocase TatC